MSDATMTAAKEGVFNVFFKGLREALVFNACDGETADGLAADVWMALANVGEEAARRAKDTLKEVSLYANRKDLQRACWMAYDEFRNNPEMVQGLNGCFGPDGVLRLPVQGLEEEGWLWVALHEVAHAADCGWVGVYSNNFGWLEAWAQELKEGDLTPYAATNPTEGLCEYLAARWSGDVTGEEFPACEAFCKAYSLIA